jgi:hypothetical protein
VFESVKELVGRVRRRLFGTPAGVPDRLGVDPGSLVGDYKNILIDLDGTVCEDIPNEESHRFPTAKVLVDRTGVSAVSWVNQLYDGGHRIVFFTARVEKDRQATLLWLRRNGFRFHDLLMGKPRGGRYVWVDNLDAVALKFSNSYSDLRPIPCPPTPELLSSITGRPAAR